MGNKQQLTPERIRAIRKGLGLTQVEAGKLLGGGPHAFTRYESGNLSPSAALSNLLRVLDKYPQALQVLGGGNTIHTNLWTPLPFEVEINQIALLDPLQFTNLLRQLLHAEAMVNGLPFCSIHVPSVINNPDEGEDGRISWQGGLGHTTFLPSRLCQFQLKAGKIKPARAGKDVISSEGKVKSMIRSVLSEGGHYFMLSTQPYNQKEIEDRREKIYEALTKVGISVSNDHIIFWGGDQITDWVNSHPAIALRIREEVGHIKLDEFASWSRWRGRSEHSLPWIEDYRLKELCARLQEKVVSPGGVLRVVGLSGIGKSRLCLEALSRIGRGNNGQCRLHDLVMYTDLSETNANAIHQIVEKLAISGRRAIIVIDNCVAKYHAIFTGMVFRSGSRLSLLTIDNEIPHRIDPDTIEIDKAPEKVTKQIIRQVAGSIQELDQIRLGTFTSGFPAIAIRISKTCIKKQDFTDPLHDDLIREFVCGSKPENSELVFKSAKLLAAFGLIRLEPMVDRYSGVEMDYSGQNHLNTIAGFSCQLTADDLHAGIQQLARRGVVKQKGGLITIEPRPIAVNLAAIQWQEWNKTKWDEILTCEIGGDLNVSAAKRLAQLNNTEIAPMVVNHVCRQDGIFDLNKTKNHKNAEVLSALAEVSPDIVAEQIDRCLNGPDSPDLIGRDAWRYLVDASSKIAFRSDTFKIGARLLLQLEIIKQPSLIVDVSNPFEKLFTPRLGGTEADGKTRLQFIEEAAHEANLTNDNSRLKLVVDALIEGCTLGGYSRNVGPEIQGLKVASKSWAPISNQEYSQYIVGCIDWLGKLVLRNDDVGEKARAEFGLTISALVCNGFIDAVERIISQVIEERYSWSMALRQLKAVEVYDSSDIDHKTLRRVQLLVEKLKPIGLRERVRILVTDAPMSEKEFRDLSFDDWIEFRCGKVQLLAEELLKNFSKLKQILPELSRGSQTMAGELGESLAKKVSRPTKLMILIVQAIEITPKDDRNYELLSGFISGLHMEYPDEVEKFKIRASKSPELAPAIPMICRRTSLSSGDIDLIIDALEHDIVSPWYLYDLSFTWVLCDVSPPTVAKLLDALIDHSAPSFALAVIILGRILSDENRKNGRPRQRSHKLSDFRPQLLRLVQRAGRMGKRESFQPPQLDGSGMMSGDMEHYHLEELVLHILSKGRGDSDARKVALALARTLADEGHDRGFNRWIAKRNSVLAKMLSGFPEIVWPLVGGMIVTNPRLASRMTYVLGQSYSLRDDDNPAILDLPEDTLFAWCHANPNVAPAFMAECLPVLGSKKNHSEGLRLHPVILRLLDEFGEAVNVHRALEINILRYSWVRSTADYYARFQEPLELLQNHSNPKVRRWAETMCGQIKRLVNRERINEAERELRWGWIG